MALAERRLSVLDRRRRETCPASALVLGMQCGGSDAFSGITANPALGFASDLLVRAGATVMFSEVTEVCDAVHLLSARAKDEEVAEALIREMDWYDRSTWSAATATAARTPRRATRPAACPTSWRRRSAPPPSPAARRSAA